MDEQPPLWHVKGLNICDPKDRSGRKSEYITHLHEKALLRYLPRGAGSAVDLGCGYGRLTPILSLAGWNAFGIDPLVNLVAYARRHFPGPEYLVGALPELPLPLNSVELMLMHNLLRPLLQLKSLHLIRGIGRYIVPKGYLMVVDNLRAGHPGFLSEDQIVKLFANEGFRLERRIPIRAARWWMIYAIRYGLVPRRYFERVADWELKRMAQRTEAPRFQYYNVLFIFRKTPEAWPPHSSDSDLGTPAVS